MVLTAKHNKALIKNLGGESVEFTTAAGKTITVKAIYERPFYGDTDGGAVAIQGRQSMLKVIEADISEIKRGDQVAVRGVDYLVAGIEHDGTGMADLTLALV